jgi:hypothetical protein
VTRPAPKAVLHAASALVLAAGLGACSGSSEPMGDHTEPQAIIVAPAPVPAPPPGPAAQPSGAGDASAAAQVVRTWIEAGSKGDEAAVRGALVERCQTPEALSVPPVNVLGAKVAIEELVVEAGHVQGDRADVIYELRGKVSGKPGKQKAEVFGMEVEVEIDAVNVDSWTTSGTVPVEKVAGAWKVSCP